MRHRPNPFVIFSAYRSDKSEAANINAHAEVIGLLNKMGLERVVLQGEWDHVPEVSILLHGKYAIIARDFAEVYEQDAILYVDEERRASLGTMEDGYIPVPVGQWKEVPEWAAKIESDQGRGFTKFDNRFYIVTEED